MTAPLTPPESDLQDFPFMPLHVARLRDSDLAAEECAEACWYAVLLWAASWHQLPAGSLPDNDAVLARLVGLGRDLRTFRKHRAAALRGFILCDDGRLYHPVVAEQVIEGWNRKLQQRWRTECARLKKQNQRNETDLPMPTFEAFLSSLRVAHCPDVVPRDTADCPQGKQLQETGTGTGTSKEEEATASLSAKEPVEAKVPVYPAMFEDAWRAYPHVKGRSSKKLAHGHWRRLPSETRLSLVAAVIRYAAEGREPKMDCGAPAMDRWIRDEKFADWLTGSTAGADWPDTRWAMAVELWRSEGAWGESLGPTPGQPGCRVPPHLLIQPTARGSAA